MTENLQQNNWVGDGMCRFVLAMLMVLCVVPLHAAEENRFGQLLAPVGARVLTDRTSSIDHFRLVLSAQKRTVTKTVADRELRVSGSLRRMAWESSEKRDLDELLQPLRNELARGMSARVLYQCQDLDCGSSHFWANEIFSNGRLVGRDNQQRYMAVYLPPASADAPSTLLLVYATQRGPRQTVVGLDVIETTDEVLPGVASREDINNMLSLSSGWLPGFELADNQLDPVASEPLLEVLSSLSEGVQQRLFLVVHCYQSNEMSVNQTCSDRLAEQLRVAAFDHGAELNVSGQAALVLPAGDSLVPALRFVFWPGR
ncbi:MULTISPECIES: DUF4892 domain-containing protein [unclassified Oceanobacter]|uniref:DUF4892 domain-containing protein n=1 Tax=unclassified Oceanobacter TaxID=2620260 RepID=UPI0027331A48|nr:MULTISPECIES: DUF4892 domain-containing protein [unclassified Oceanobacter]MDP2507033.1 DUF4892 domain-containing protein [Oceanobacter sp. 3_MG-2023]MDP2548145.1 DUF4892 domain-containing protein [Oceanobacter sp. 4_MG-2023]MDP2609554.1 DUF4892 domain-containing protein [Oceanobacter sp. 1_MG-2023]MDP2612985.1 DUF4892 domain-containing protein [Oceanobacter sp. 2_MG-2023]